MSKYWQLVAATITVLLGMAAMGAAAVTWLLHDDHYSLFFLIMAVGFLFAGEGWVRDLRNERN